MRVSPIILSAAVELACVSGRMAQNDIIKTLNYSFEEIMIAAAVAGVSTGTTTTKTNLQKNIWKTQRKTELSTEFFLIPDIHYSNNDNNSISSVASVISVPAPNRTISIGHNIRNGVLNSDGTKLMPGVRLHGGIYGGILRQKTWAMPLAALSAAAMLLMASFEIFVLLKARAAAPSRRHLFLGQALLLGLFMLAGLSASVSLVPNPVSCAAFRLVGLPACLIFAALLVKCVFLLSLNSGIYLPAPYQALVLVFAVLVQVAIVGQWFYGETPDVIRPCLIGAKSVLLQHHHQQNYYTCCKTPLGQTVASLGYPGALLIAVACLAVRARGVRDNYRESAFIGIAVGLTVPIWLTSAIGSAIAIDNDREAWIAYGLLLTSFVVFLTMFLPKGRQLAALGREGPGGIPSTVMANGRTVVIRDDDDDDDDDNENDRLSSLPGSGYSPSFYHFKPAESTSLTRKMHFHSTDRIALVSSGIPECSACRHANSPGYTTDDLQTPAPMYIGGTELDAVNLYTTLSAANPNVFFQRAHPGMIY